MSLPRTFGRRNHQQQQHLEQDVDLGHDPGGRLSFSVSSKNSPIPMRTNAFTVLPPLSPQIPGPPPTPKPYRCRPPQLAKKENSAFVILTEIARARTPSPPGGRVSPFRGRGFKPGNSRHASPSPDPKSKAGGHSPRSKQARIVKGITVGKSAPSSPSKRSNIPKPIVPRRTSLSPNRAKEIVDRNSKDSNGNLLQVNGGGYLDRRDTFNKKPPPTPNRRIKSPVRIELPDIGSKTTKMPVSILKSPKKPVPDKNNNPVNVKTNLNRSRSRNDSNMNRRNLNLREGKENAALIKKPPTREVNINVPRSPNMNAPRSPGRTATNDPGKRSLNQKPPLPPTDTKTRQKSGSSPSPNPKKRVPLVPSKNMATVSSNNSKLNIQKPNNINNKSRSSSPTKPNIRPRSKTPVNNSKNDDIKKTDRGGGNINNKTVNNNNNNKSSNKIDKNSNKNNKSNTNGDVLRSNAGDSDNNNITNLTKSPKKEVDGKKPVSGGVEPAKVEVVNERKTNDKKIGSPTKSRPSSAKSPVSKRAEKDASTQESSMSTMKTGTAGASSMVVPVEPNISPKVTTMTTTSTVNEKEATSSSSKIPSPVKRVNQVQNQSAESVRSSSSRETIRAVARVKGTVNSTASQRRSKVTSVAGKVKGGPDLEVLSANTLMSDSNHTGSRMAWTDSPSRPTEELTNQTTTSVKPTGCLGNICKLLNCCRCCQNWQKKPRPAAAVGADVSQKPSPLERLNCFKKCPSLNLGDRIGSMCGKLNCCRKLNLSGCCKGRGLSSCCQKLSCCSSCCRRRSSSISEDDSSDISSDEPKIKCANLKSCWRFAFCLNRACCQRVRQMCRCRNLNCCKPGGCCGRISPEEEAMRKKKNSKAAFRRSKTSSIFSEIPKLDTTFVEYNSIMRGAIPVLPVPVAWMCLILNFVLPGVGTLWSGLMCLYFGKPRFSVNDTPLARIGSFCINIMVAFAQMFTVLFCLVGWGWAIWWGVIMLRLARKHRRIKLAEAGAPPESRPTPVVLNQNHADAERGQP